MLDVQQLVDAHGALVRLKKAEAAIEAGAGDLTQVGNVINALVSDPGPGKPPQVQALNGAAITLLSGHLQGYLTDLHEEAAKALFDGKISSLKALTDTAPTRGNPNQQNINKLFASLGFEKILDGVSWQKMSNESLKGRLRDFNELRNRVAHGNGETVSKAKVDKYKSVIINFAKKMDQKVRKEIKKVTGTNPW